jgi:mandelate racemase
MAAWDALACAHGVSLLTVLGAASKPIPASGATGYDRPLDCARVAEDWAKRGFRGVKKT